MIAGIALLGVVTATIASWLVQRVAEEDAQREVATAAQVAELLVEMRSLRASLLPEQRAATSAKKDDRVKSAPDSHGTT